MSQKQAPLSVERSSKSMKKYTTRSNRGNAYENYMAMRAQSQKADESQDAYSDKESFVNDDDVGSTHDFGENGNSSGKNMDMTVRKSKTHKRPQSCYNFKLDDHSSFSSEENKLDSQSVGR